MKKQYIYIILLLNVTLFFSANAQTEKLEFDQVNKIKELSSENEESMPFPYANGEKIYFVRTVIVGSMKQRVKGQDIWSSEYNGSSWSDPSNLFEAGNDNGNNGVIGVSNDGNTLYLFNSVQTRRKLAKGIAITERDADGNWSDLEQVEVPGFKIGDGLYSFYMTPDAKTLLIGMAANDTSSQSDLFISLKNTEGNWGKLRNLGATINTGGSEITPFIGKDGTSLYFSSDGHKGLGGMDIFVAKRLDDSWTNWSTPVNLGDPINSKEFDAYFMFTNQKEAVFTSNREGLFSDIYSTKLKEKVLVKKEETVFAQMFLKQEPLKEVDLLIIDMEGKLIEKRTTDGEGKFSFVKLENEPYNIKLDGKNSEQTEAKIYLTDKFGKKLKRLKLDENGAYTEDLSKFDKDLVQGVFEYDSIPQENIALIVIDENGFPIDTVITDKDGKFSYDKLHTDNNFTIKPLMNIEDQVVENMQVYATDKSGTRLSNLIINKNQETDSVRNKVKELASNTPEKRIPEKKVIVESSEKDQSGRSSIQPSAKKVVETTSNSIQPKSTENVIYFDFNERTLSEDDKLILDKVISALRGNSKARVTMIGFTDNIGSKEINVKVASARARAARAYLTENRIDKNKITIYGYGEVMFKGDNSTIEGRALNRRVEIEIK